MPSTTELIFGPLVFTHVVQKISIQERKAVEALDTTRSGRNFLVDSGDSEHKAQIRLLFTGIEEINGSISDTGPSGLRALIALFKCCPILSCKNVFLSSSWKQQDEIYDKQNKAKISQFLNFVTEITQELNLDVINTRMKEYNRDPNRKWEWDPDRPWETEPPVLVDLPIPPHQWSDEDKKKFYILYNINQLRAERTVPTAIKAAENLAALGVGEALDSTYFKKNKYYSEYIPITFDSLTIENVPDMPNAMQATITISRVDVSSVFESGEVEYLREEGTQAKTIDPREAYWLKGWIKKTVEEQIPELLEVDLRKAVFSWYAEDTAGEVRKGDREVFEAAISTDPTFVGSIWESSNLTALLISESCTLRHKFAYNKLTASHLPSPQHMGVSARFASMDFVFNNQASYDSYKMFSRFKESSDYIVRSKERIDRVSGWAVKTPVTKLMSGRNGPHSFYNDRGIFVPLSVYLESGDQPHMVNARIDMAENNIDYFKENLIVKLEGGTDLEGLRKFYDKVIEGELSFRSDLINKNIDSIANLLSEQSLDLSNLDMYRLFWPIEETIFKFNNESRHGLLNIDTMRAVLMHIDETHRGSRLKKVLIKSPLGSGKVALGNKTVVSLVDKVKVNWPIYRALLNGLDISDINVIFIFKEVEAIVRNHIIYFEDAGSAEIDTFLKETARHLTNGLLGDRTLGILRTQSTTGAVIQQIAKTKWKFHQNFLDSLFNVIVERKPVDALLPHIYSSDGIYSAFYKLITTYALRAQSTITKEDARRDLLKATQNDIISGTHPDLYLPTYETLFGADRWQEFAPTIDDLGLDYDAEVVPGVDHRSLPAVDSKDIVSPAAWFYTRRVKNGSEESIRAYADTILEAVDSVGKGMSISLPFNTEDIEELKQLLASKREGNERTKHDSTVSEIIERALEKKKLDDPSKFRQDLINLELTYGEKFAQKYFSDKDNIKIYAHNNDNLVIPKQLTIPGLGAEIYRVVSKKEFLASKSPADVFTRLDADEVMTTPFDKEVKYHRHLNDTTKQTISSAIDQIPDDQYSPERFFPAIKVYLVDRRGNDIILDDTLFSVASIVSVDITKDRDDADLAVIKIADPLYSLQNDYFSRGNIVDKKGRTVDKAKDGDKVLHSSRSDGGASLRRYKLAQGRAVQIRIGYSSMAYNLPIVFTGRITEILPGDELTVVAQGWKAELINRQVNFYNDNPKNWGARDLAIQAITYANPDGFGDFFPEHDARLILRNLDREDVQTIVPTIFRNNEGVDLETVGTRSMGSSIKNWLVRQIGLASTDKVYKGFDTRLKNIWYPDTTSYNNLFGARTTLGMMPSYLNDSWIVPLQPAWDVLKEAARHAWNCVVQVVPYDTYATIFMGHPDQMYYYTRGSSYARSAYNKYISTRRKEVRETMDTILERFIRSPYYLSESVTFGLLTPPTSRGIPSLPNADQIAFAGKSAFLYAIEGLKGYQRVLSNRGVTDISTSPLPSIKLNEAKNLGMFEDTATYLFCLFFGLDRYVLQGAIPDIGQQIEQLLASKQTPDDIEKFTQSLFERTKDPNISVIPAIAERIDRLYLYWTEEVPRTNIQGIEFGVFSLKKELSDTAQQLQDVKASPDLFPIIESTVLAIQEAIRPIEDRFTYPFEHPHLQEVIKPNGRLREVQRQVQRLFVVYQNSKNYGSDVLRRGFIKSLGIDTSNSVRQVVADNYYLFKAFVYFFCKFLVETAEGQQVLQNIKDSSTERVPANMKTFRLHHYVDDTNNIIQNNIVATTREMWNTVVVEHPAAGSAETQVEDDEQLYTKGRLNAGANWIYWPKQEVTGVIGLQYHPGLTLSNKKIKVFTELNCQTADLAAKLACGHLAEGIRKMYRGNLLILGKDVKPHDRLILVDRYVGMSGPVEVDSVIHHWNTRQGWVTNIMPNAVCDANPGAAILQTAIMETTYQGIFNVLEFVSDAITVATIVATLGAATPLAVGQFSIRKGTLGLAKRFLTRSPGRALMQTASNYKRTLMRLGKGAASNAAGLLQKGHRLDLLRFLYKEFGGPAISLLRNELRIAFAEYGVHMAFRLNTIPAFVEAAEDAEQLPVILAPLLYNGNPFTAGLEAEDSIWAVSAFGAYYSAKEFQAAASRFWNDLFNGI